MGNDIGKYRLSIGMFILELIPPQLKKNEGLL